MNCMEMLVPAKKDEIARVTAEIDKFLNAQDFPRDAIYNVELALEEVIVNIIMHGYRGGEGMIGIRCEVSPSRVYIEISDSATPFNPLSVPEPDVTAGIDERRIGGLGIFLVQKVMDEVRYRYEDGKNILILVKAGKD